MHEQFIYLDTDLVYTAAMSPDPPQWWKHAVNDLTRRIEGNIHSLERIKFMFQAIEYRRIRTRNSFLTRVKDAD